MKQISLIIIFFLLDHCFLFPIPLWPI
uniref:Uncharacterized protein n=1 Tax=Rhizophora mucronata TaxID=61149 RepID=A0A2P2Q139_RHIMU